MFSDSQSRRSGAPAGARSHIGRALPLLVLGMLGACATTSDPYECASRGVASPFCQGAVNDETKRLEGELTEVEADISATNSEQAQRQQVREQLQARADQLKGELREKSIELDRMRADLAKQLSDNAIDRVTYDTLSSDLEDLSVRIAEYETMPANVYTEETVRQVTSLVEIEYAEFSSRVEEFSISNY